MLDGSIRTPRAARSSATSASLRRYQQVPAHREGGDFGREALPGAGRRAPGGAAAPTVAATVGLGTLPIAAVLPHRACAASRADHFAVDHRSPHRPSHTVAEDCTPRHNARTLGVAYGTRARRAQLGGVRPRGSSHLSPDLSPGNGGLSTGIPGGVEGLAGRSWHPLYPSWRPTSVPGSTDEERYPGALGMLAPSASDD